MSRKIVHQPLGHRTTLQLQDRGHNSRLFEVVDLTVGKHSQQSLKQQRKNGRNPGWKTGSLDWWILCALGMSCRSSSSSESPEDRCYGQQKFHSLPSARSRLMPALQMAALLCCGTGRRITHILYQFRILISVYFHDPVMTQRPGPLLPSPWKLGVQGLKLGGQTVDLRENIGSHSRIST